MDYPSLHDLCSAQVNLVWKQLSNADCDAALTWIPTWLTFPTERPTQA